MQKERTLLSAPALFREICVVFVQYAESVNISFLPRLGLPAEMQDGCISHYPVHVAYTAAS